jgi:Tfp pilus assembly protein PilX
MLVVLMVMLMMTVLGVAAITVSGLENKIAGLQRTTENAAQAAESCLGTSANVIMQT